MTENSSYKIEPNLIQYSILVRRATRHTNNSIAVVYKIAMPIDVIDCKLYISAVNYSVMHGKYLTVMTIGSMLHPYFVYLFS